MQASALPLSLRKIPWATYGRRESPQQMACGLERQRAAAALFAYQPTFHFTVAAGQASASLNRLIDSLRAQSYPHWTLEIDGPARSSYSDLRLELNSRADYRANLQTDWILSPVFLYEVVARLQAGDAREIYGNEVRLSPDLKRIEELIYRREFSSLEVNEFEARGELRLHLMNPKAGCRDSLFISQFQVYRVKGAPVVCAHPTALRSDAPSGDCISAIVCFRNRASDTIRALQSLARQVGQTPLELILVDNDSHAAEAEKILSQARKLFSVVRWVAAPGPFNFAKLNNEAIRKTATGNLILLLNNDVEIQGERHLDLLAQWARRPEIGTVSVQLRYPDGRIQQAGLGVSAGGGHRLVRLGNAVPVPEIAELNREVFANGFALCLFRRENFEAVGGLEETRLQNGFGDADFSFKLRELGKRHFCLGTIQATHQEGASRGVTYEFWEECEIERRYPQILRQMLREDFRVEKYSRWRNWQESLRLAAQSTVVRLRSGCQYFATLVSSVSATVR